MPTTADRLATTARSALEKAQGNIDAAAVALDRTIAAQPDLRRALARDYLTRLASAANEYENDAHKRNDTHSAGGVVEPGHHETGTHATGAGLTPIENGRQPANETQVGDATVEPGHPADEIQQSSAGLTPSPPQPKDDHSRRRTGAKRKPQRRLTPEQRAAALESASHYGNAAPIWLRKLRGGRLLGSVRCREVDALIAESSHTAGSFLNRGYEDSVDTLLLRKIRAHGVPSDPDMLLRDFIKADTANAFLGEAQIDAASFIRDSAARIALDLSTKPMQSAQIEVSP